MLRPFMKKRQKRDKGIKSFNGFTLISKAGSKKQNKKTSDALDKSTLNKKHRAEEGTVVNLPSSTLLSLQVYTVSEKWSGKLCSLYLRK